MKGLDPPTTAFGGQKRLLAGSLPFATGDAAVNVDETKLTQH